MGVNIFQNLFFFERFLSVADAKALKQYFCCEEDWLIEWLSLHSLFGIVSEF
uniref:Uncharacterized protein n=1 Tax=Anguilla anguilla TaxID=7936 RepID=A0A0E9QTK7_ANGAN